jgi:hypothetical protein
MQEQHEAYRRATASRVAQFRAEKQATVIQETDACEKKNCECTQNQPCACKMCLEPTGCCLKDSLRQFVISQAEAHPEAEFYQKMLAKYIEADIERSEREGKQRDVEASVCVFAPHVIPIVMEALPMLRTLAEREFSMQSVTSLISTVLGSPSSAKDKQPNDARSASSVSQPTFGKEKVCTSSCCAETMGF